VECSHWREAEEGARSKEQGLNLYALALFVHLVGMIGIFAGICIWLFSASLLRRAQTVEQARLLAGTAQTVGNLVVASIIVLAAGGLYMALTVWIRVGADWIVVATASFLLLAPAGAFILDPRLRAIATSARALPNGSLPAQLAARVRDPILGAGLQIYIAVLFGIVFLMVTKPPLTTAIVVMIAALALGIASTGPVFWRAAHVQEPVELTLRLG
jgi:hypothetical protein